MCGVANRSGKPACHGARENESQGGHFQELVFQKEVLRADSFLDANPLWQYRQKHEHTHTALPLAVIFIDTHSPFSHPLKPKSHTHRRALHSQPALGHVTTCHSLRSSGVTSPCRHTCS